LNLGGGQVGDYGRFALPCAVEYDLEDTIAMLLDATSV